MKLLLTSGGIQNRSIHEALLALLGKPIQECRALCISTASYAIPGGIQHAWKFYAGLESTPMCELGWKSLGVLELTALPSVGKDLWVPQLLDTDVLLVNGGDPMYLCYWMKQSGLAQLLPNLNLVYVGLSAGSMIMAPRIGKEFVGWNTPEGNDETLGFVNFAIFPHLNHVMLPENTLEEAKKWAKNLSVPSYAIDDQTAIIVVNETIEVISEGQWQYLPFSQAQKG